MNLLPESSRSGAAYKWSAIRLWSLLIGLLLLVAKCGVEAASRPARAPRIEVDVLRAFPHDPGAFTQGLVVRNGQIFESTGLYGQSTVRRVDLDTGAVLQTARLPDTQFGEGLAIWKNTLVVLTWQSGQGHVLDLDSFKPVRTFAYPGEGWGLARTDRELVMSDGSSAIRFLDPDTFEEKRRIAVTDGGRPVKRLNELEWINGEIWANVWQTDRIATINPEHGNVTGWIDLSGLLQDSGAGMDGADVLNGIAYDSESGRIFVTGKQWPRLFEIRLKQNIDRQPDH